jgi:integrase
VDRPCPDRQIKPTADLLADVIDEYLANSKGHKQSHKDDARYRGTWTKRFAGRTLDEVTPAELDKIRTARLATRKGDDERTIGAATVNREFAFLKHVYNVAIRDGKAEANPVSKLRMLRESSGRTRYLSDEEEDRLMKALGTDEDRAKVTVLLHTGFRRGELHGLRWRDVDFKAGVLTVPKSKNGDSRPVPMTSTVRELLSRRPRSLDKDALVFCNSVGTRDLRWAIRTFPAAIKAAAIGNFRLHDTRHTFASRLAMEGIELLTIKGLGGWKSPADGGPVRSPLPGAWTGGYRAAYNPGAAG